MKRDKSIDFFRSLGLLLIIFVHINGPYWFSQFRCFDVPLMVFVSGLVYSGRKITNISTFYLHRVLRLVVPVWLFFGVVYFPTFYMGECLGNIPKGYINYKQVISTFLLLQGYGYVWIIRVFLLVMLATPFLIKINEEVKSFNYFLLILFFLICLESFIVRLFSQCDQENIIVCFVSNYVVYLLAYSVFFLLGLKMKSSNKMGGYKSFIICSLLLVVVGMAIYAEDGELTISPKYKYPPQFFYIIYGCTMCYLLWCNRKIFSVFIEWEPFQFVGKNTIWIYLWHIPFVYLCNQEIEFWLFRYFIVLIASIGLYYLQYKIVMLLGNKAAKRYLVG